MAVRVHNRRGHGSLMWKSFSVQQLLSNTEGEFVENAGFQVVVYLGLASLSPNFCGD